jgi:hypothetical protein
MTERTPGINGLGVVQLHTVRVALMSTRVALVLSTIELQVDIHTVVLRKLQAQYYISLSMLLGYMVFAARSNMRKLGAIKFLEAKLPLDLPLPPPPFSLSFQLFPPLHGLFARSLFSLFPLTLLIQSPALHNALNNFFGIHMLEIVTADLFEDSHVFCRCIRVEIQRHKARWAMSHDIRCTVWESFEIGFRWGEGCAEYDSLDKL